MKREIQRFLVGTYTEPIRFGTGNVFQGRGRGIYAFAVDRSNNTISATGIVPEVRNPSYLTCSSDSRLLFCVNELKDENNSIGGTVSSFAMGAELGDPEQPARLINSRPTDGADPCFVTLDTTGNFLFTANYMSGSICVHPVSATGELGPIAAFRQHFGSGTNMFRQEGPHAHAVAVSPDNRFIFVPDLGTDTVVAYEFDAATGMLLNRADRAVKTVSGAGPRHLVFSPAGTYAYLINELDSTIVSFRYDADSGQLTRIDRVSTLPEGYRGSSSGAHIALSPDGRFVYGSNRGHDSIVVFRVDQLSGKLSLVGHTASGGQCPRSFALDPSGSLLVVANQNSDLLTVFSVDRAIGTLCDTGRSVFVPTPVSVVFTGTHDEPRQSGSDTT